MDTPTLVDDTASVAPRYATFTRRLRAMLADTVILFGVFIAAMFVGDAADSVPGSGRLAWLVMFGAVFLYEPLFIWRRGATIGHAMNHLVVVADRTGQPPNLAQAFARYFIKVILGVVSFVTMGLTRKHQAIHDALTGTTVQLAPGTDDELFGFHVERDDDLGAPPLPSRLRRAALMVVYLALLFIVYGIAVSSIDPQGCVRERTCSGTTRLVMDGVTLVWLGVSLLTVVAAGKGMLPGARRSRTLQREDVACETSE